ncbi:MAG: serine hydrolase domain-containing protein [Anaerolineae bacterium]
MFMLPHMHLFVGPSLPAAFPQLEPICRAFADQYPVPGLAYGVVVNGQLVHAGGVGVQNLQDQSPVTPDSIFRIASMTKSFTAMAVVKLRDAGLLNLDDPAERYVPQLTNLCYPTRDSARITVRYLLTMGAGFPQDDPWADRQLALHEDDFTAWLAQGFSFSNPPGVTYEYSNTGYAILGRVITNVSGVPYQQYVVENILKPLGMTSSGFNIAAVPPTRLAMGYQRDDDQWREELPLPDGAFASIGGLFTTVTDFARYMAYLLSAFPARDDDETGPICRSSLREMQQAWRPRILMSMRSTPDTAAFVQSDGYGYGLACGVDSRLGYSVSHGGGLPGYGTFYRLLPDCSMGIVVLTNRTYTGAARCVNDLFYALQSDGHVKPRLRPVAPVLQEMQTALTNLYATWDDDAMTALATQSFFQDMPLEKRRRQVKDLRSSFGSVVSSTPFEAENALRGRWSMNCKRGRIDVFMTLAPTIPPRLQHLEFTAAKSLKPAFKRKLKNVLRLLNHWDKTQAKLLVAKPLKPKMLKPQVAALAVHYGKLKWGDVLEGDGRSWARLRLVGKQGSVDMKAVLHPKSGKITELTFTKPRETAFVP